LTPDQSKKPSLFSREKTFDMIRTSLKGNLNSFISFFTVVVVVVFVAAAAVVR